MATVRSPGNARFRGVRTGATGSAAGGGGALRGRARGSSPIGFTIEQFKKSFFRPEAINSAVDRATFIVNRAIGRYVQRIAQTKLKKQGVRYPSAASLPPDIFTSYQARRRVWHIRGSDPAFEPKLPYIPSRPGEPPRKIKGKLRKFLFFGQEQSKRNVIVGPAILTGGRQGPSTIPETHEHAGVTLARIKGGGRGLKRYPLRQYMRPAMQEFNRRGGPARFWKDKVKP